MKRKILQFVMLAALLGANRALAQDDTNAPVNDYRSYQIISSRNIFNPNRRSLRSNVSTYVPATRIDSFTLVGTMSYEKGQYAFFDGNSSQYRKTLNVGQTIAGYKIAAIGAEAIQLAAVSNKTINLPIGAQMRRRDGGPWAFTGQAEAVPDSSASPTSAMTTTNSPSTTPSAPASASMTDAMKRLMQRRLEEQ